MNNKPLSHQYNPIANTFETVISSQQEASRNAIKKLVPKFNNESVLDLGCGEGTDCNYYKSQGAGYVVGVDASQELLNKALTKYPDCVFQYGLFEEIPFGDNTFDYVYSKYAIMTSADLSPIFEEVQRVLKTGGVFTLLVSHPIRQLYEKKKDGKDYFEQEVVDSVCFDGALIFKEPSHTLKEYFSDFMLSNFELLHYSEEFDPAAEKIKDTYPGFLVLQWRKK